MKFNKILMATLLILAILSIGAVSASDSDDSSYLSSSDDNIIDDDDWDDEEWEDDDDWEDDDGEDWEDDEDEDLYVFSDVDVGNIYYTEGNTVIAYLKDLPSNATGTFSIIEGGFTIATKTVVNGNANFTLSELDFCYSIIGDHDLYAKYDDGDDIYGKSIYITVVDYKLIPPSENVYLGDEAVFTFLMPNNYNGCIEFFEDEDLIGNATVVNGVGKIVLSGLKLGTHYIDYSYDGEGYPFNDFFEIVVAPKKIATVSKAYIGADNFFTVTLPSDARGLLSVELRNIKTHNTIDIEDLKYTNGKAVIPASMLPVGTYEITNFFIEDKKYGDYSFVDLPSYVEDDVFAKVNVVYPPITFNKIKSLKKTTKSVTLKVTVGKGTGKNFKNNRVTFKFNTKTYTRTLNNNGVAKVTISNKVFKNFKNGKTVNYQVKYFKKTIKYSIRFKVK